MQQAVNLAVIPLYTSQSLIFFKNDGGSSFLLSSLQNNFEHEQPNVGMVLRSEDYRKHLRFLRYSELSDAIGFSGSVVGTASVQTAVA